MAESEEESDLERIVPVLCCGVVIVIPFFSTIMQGANGDGSFHASPKDAITICFLTAILTVMRKFSIMTSLQIADLLRMPTDEKRKFAQNGWVGLYYAVAFIWGLIEIYGTDYWFSTQGLWAGYPHTASMSLSLKLYFLFQSAFWVHMVFVTLVEPRQKDFWVMLIHHFVTLAMLVGSYGLGHLRVAHAILVEQDLADIFLPAAKMFNYMAKGENAMSKLFQTIADILFPLFAVIWIATRHVILPVIYYAIWMDAHDGMIAAGCACGQGNLCVWAPEKGCIITAENWGTVLNVYKVFLFVFQCLLLVWLRDLLLAIVKTLKTGSSSKAEEDSLTQSKKD
jgi:acyl-CoA-dependent ceramide synthase